MASNKIYGNPTVTPINVAKVTSDTIPTKVSQLDNDKGYLTETEVDEKVKNAEVKEGSIALKHLSEEVLDNLGGGEDSDKAVEAIIFEHDLKLQSDRIQPCEVSGIEYVSEDGRINGASFLAIFDAFPTGTAIPIGSSVYILLSDGEYHLYTVTSNIPISKTITAFTMSSNYVDDALNTDLQNGLTIVEGESSMYVIFAHSYYDGEKVDMSNYLSKNNTKAYTPTFPYNPATKQYVDNKVKNIESTGGVQEGSIGMEHLSQEVLDNLGGGGDVDLSNYLSKDNKDEYTPESDYNPATKRYVDDSVNVVNQNTAGFGGQIAENAFEISKLTSELHNDYYAKNEVDGAIAEVNEAIAKIDVPKVDSEKSRTNTIAVFEGVRTDVIETDGTGIDPFGLYMSQDLGVVQYILEFDILPSDPIEVNTVDGVIDSFAATNPTVINVNDPKYEPYGGINFIYINPAEGARQTIVKKVYGDSFVKADVIEGSIEDRHLKQRYVKKTDYPTASVAGVVKIDRAKQGLLVTDTGELRVYCAEQGEVKAKSSGSGHKPVSVQNFDYALAFGTHQSMSDEYKVSDVKIHPYVKDIHQGQLPASYDAVKGYVDEKFAELAYLIDELRTKIE